MKLVVKWYHSKQDKHINWWGIRKTFLEETLEEGLSSALKNKHTG